VNFEFIEHPSTATTGSDDNHPDQLLLDIIPFVLSEPDHIEIPNLQQVADDVAKTPSLTEIYNKDTYLEFHRLLCFMLDRFHQSLVTLQSLHETITDSDGVKISPNILKTIYDVLNVVVFSGRCLRGIVRSAAIEKHLKTIAHLLEVDMKSWMLALEDEEEAEFHDLKPYSTYQGQLLLPWQSYKDWLRLTVLYFDATTILLDHVHSLPSAVISIKILSPRLPDQDQKMLSWKKLLRNENYFPKANDPSELSVERLISFLTSDFNVLTEVTHNKQEEGKKGKPEDDQVDECEKVTIEQVIVSVQKLKNSQEKAIAAEVTVDIDNWTTTIDSVRSDMKVLRNCSSPGAEEYITAIVRRLGDLKKYPTKLSRTQEILEMIEALRTHSSLYQMLKEGTALSRGDRFFGTRHCEVCIASILGEPGPQNESQSQFREIRSEFSVSHIFMLCSNVPQILQYRAVAQL
jgi:hypothetical protein